MARRGVANYDPPGDDQNDATWWRQVMHSSRDGVPDAQTMLGLPRTGRSNYIGIASNATDTLREPWDGSRSVDPMAKTWHPARVLSQGLSESGRAGKSSWHHNVNKPATCRVNLCNTSSAGFCAPTAPHLTATISPRRRAPLEMTGFSSGTSPRPVVQSGNYHTLPTLGFQAHYHPKIY